MKSLIWIFVKFASKDYFIFFADNSKFLDLIFEKFFNSELKNSPNNLITFLSEIILNDSTSILIPFFLSKLKDFTITQPKIT
jgi:hypothetical protein